MKLYLLPGVCSLGDHIILRWAKADFEPVVMSREGIKSPEYLAINPTGSVPTLVEDDGWVLTENVAILDYLGGKYPEARLHGDNPRERAEVFRWLGQLNSDVHKAFSPIFSPGVFFPEGTDMERAREMAVQRIHQQLGQLDARLEGRTRPVGERRTLVDGYLFVILRWARKVAGGIDRHQNLSAFFQRMNDDPDVQAALELEGLQ
ncbi:MAG: glutathione S-transferase N-terminal domain-containing protein [Rhodanobacteraceae bacterium]|nr:glutathione S-transferase N-terminal domain-containing protein [Xanthomonadales bacterium]MCP5479699.1 glutathione S-transferase N-terminal domain-containing protein [Rhodanobacteraceae bacterium]HPF74089.1 glutathione S-transferase N-terminal domain-containing protein [Xanthomonadaceae bacterium]